MFNSKTTFVIGAGASLELGFPTSDLLKTQISKALNIKFDYSSAPISGDRSIATALQQFVEPDTQKNTDEYNANLHAGWHIAEAMPQAISIDNFVEVQEDERVTRMAKLAIASCLIEAEKNCLKHYRAGKDYQELVDWPKFQENWIHHLIQTVTEGCKKSDVENIFSNLNFIIFNYDRSLEYFLTKGIENFYGIKKQDAEKIVAGANFIHPYGQIGKLRWQDNSQPIAEFGSGHKQNLYEISQSLYTFSERIDDEGLMEKLKNYIHDAEQLVFLGFAFHQSNMDLIKPDARKKDTNRVIASAYGISKPDCRIVEEQILELCFEFSHYLGLDKDGTVSDFGQTTADVDGQIVLDNGAKCSDIFSRYRRSLIS